MLAKKQMDVLFERIDVSLRYGTVHLSKTEYILLVFGLIFGFIFAIGFMFVAIFIETQAIIGIIIFLIIAVICTVILVRFRRLKSRIMLWLEDAVELKAKCSTLGKMPKEKEKDELLAFGAIATVLVVGMTTGLDVSGGPNFDSAPNPRIKVVFKHNGKVVKRISGKQGYSVDEMETGRSPVFKKFIGKNIDILYSPKYDQVLILKL